MSLISHSIHYNPRSRNGRWESSDIKKTKDRPTCQERESIQMFAGISFDKYGVEEDRKKN